MTKKTFLKILQYTVWSYHEYLMLTIIDSSLAITMKVQFKNGNAITKLLQMIKSLKHGHVSSSASWKCTRNTVTGFRARGAIQEMAVTA